ncbi:MAG: 4Fe-4S binding protein [Planctomycetota bacterium]|nr:MAG: 4Fe-4S binding protein [Planctomycetota bacterium]
MEKKISRTQKRLTKRLQTIWKLGHRKEKTTHRYFIYRLVSFLVIHAFIAIVPLSGIMRFDFWGGNHMIWGEQAPLLEVARRFVIPFGVANILIVLVVRWSGRYLCGWVCPVNFMNRWADWLRGFLGAKNGRLGFKGHAMAAFTSIMFAGVFLLWFVDFRVFIQGSPRAILWSLVAWSFFALFSYVQMVALSWRTCERYCPSGVYFSILGVKTKTGIERNPNGTPCADCKLCITACPMDLDPRNLLGEAREVSGVYFDTLDNSALCIRCGDCVEACDRFFEPRKLPATLRMGVLQNTGSALPEPKAKKARKTKATSPSKVSQEKPESHEEGPEDPARSSAA